MRIRRFKTNPIITQDMDASLGNNINGPSLIKVPSWVQQPLGKYYLYFAHHGGKFIRLAYADFLSGPWKIYAPGVLKIEQTPCHNHIASPDIYIDEDNKKIRMYYHGPSASPSDEPKWIRKKLLPGWNQRSFVALSDNGIDFCSRDKILGPSYMRVFKWRDDLYALIMPGVICKSQNGFDDFEFGIKLFNNNFRHGAVYVHNDKLFIFYTNAGDCPEHILFSTINLTNSWKNWVATDPVSLIHPQEVYEGALEPKTSSKRGPIMTLSHQLRDPAIYTEENRLYLVYAAGGENSLAIAEIEGYEYD